MSKPKQPKSSTGPKRSADEILRDRAETARLRLEGKTQEQIAQWFALHRPYKLSQQTIANDLKVVRDGWLSSSVDDYEKTRLVELARLDEEERLIKAAWERSIQPVIRREVGEVGGKVTDKRVFDEYEDGTIAKRDGNLGCLARLESIRLRRCRILGFVAHQAIDDSNVAIMKVVSEGYTVRDPEAVENAD